jgi:HSP20 family protein
MSDRDINPFDLYRRLFGGNEIKKNFDREFLRELDDMQREMERMFNQFNDIQSNSPKELVREYQTSEGKKVREFGPIVYGYSMTIGPDGKPQIREFGNVKSTPGNRDIKKGGIKSHISAEREPLSDIYSTDKEVKIVLEMPGIKKEDIKINAIDNQVEVTTAENSQRKYNKAIELPKEADIETAKSTYNNGILEVTFDKKKENKPKGKEIKID